MTSITLGSCTFIHGDCLELMRDIPDKSVDLILCDLPYGTTQNKWDSVIPLAPLWSEYRRIRNGPCVLTASQPFTSVLTVSNLSEFKHEWIWIKNRGSNFANTVREPFKEHESVLVFSDKKWTYNKQMQERTGAGLERVAYGINNKTASDNYRVFSREEVQMRGELRVPSSWQKFNTEVGLHPTQKPVALMEYLIRTYTNEDDTVLDNCFGSGTTAIACIRTGRKFIGHEQDEGYFNTAVDRVRKELEQMSLL